MKRGKLDREKNENKIRLVEIGSLVTLQQYLPIIDDEKARV